MLRKKIRGIVKNAFFQTTAKNNDNDLHGQNDEQANVLFFIEDSGSNSPAPKE